MIKALFFAVLVANILLLVSSTDSTGYEVTSSSSSAASSSSSSSFSSSSSASSSSSSTVTENGDDDEAYDDNDEACDGDDDSPPAGCDGDPNAEAITGCGSGCRKSCSNYKQFDDLICPAVCRTGCDCKPGYVYDDALEKCVLPTDCTPTCGLNEVFSECTQGLCRNQYCTQKGMPVACPKLTPGSCKKGCVCQENYLRAENGTCIPENQCPACPDGEYFNTCPAAKCDAEYCPKDRNSPQSCISTRNCGEPRCTCGFNQKRNRKTGKCVAIADCPPFKCDGPNEEYQTCPPVCPGQNCSDYINNSTCPKFGRIGIVVPCKPQCRCKENYYRNSKGICVTGKQCKKEAPAGCNGDPNAQAIKGCGSGCQKSCSNYKQFNDLICPAVCRTGCDCKPGYVYDNALKKCVLPTDCTPTCGLNEVFSECTQGVCRNQNCTQKGMPVACPGLTPGSCKKGCVCQENYLRAENGTCIPENQCPDQSCGGDPNAKPGCGQNCGRRCSNFNKGPVACPLICKVGGCDCKPDYVFDDNIGKCVLPSQCNQSCGGDPNAKPGCGQNCGRRCSNFNKGPVACPLICKVGGCDCKPDYVFDDNIGKCVLPSQCTPVCGINEYFSNCTNGGCFGAINCSEKGRPIKCVKLVPSACKKGCLCEKGYLRNKKGDCVLEKQCEGFQKCTKPNEVYEECPGTCPARTCAVDDRLVFCPKQPTVGDPNCKPAACKCASGFYRNKNGDCVTWDECRNNQTCPENEVYDLCPTKCPFRTCGIDDLLIDCVPSPRVGDPDCAPPACRCADGFYRNDKGVCVRLEDCPKCNNSNEVYDPCPPTCPEQSCDVDESVIRCKAPPQLGDPECKAGCRCEDGFKRNKAGQCIPKDMCKNCTRPYEYYDLCPDTCTPQSCASISQRYNCPLQKLNKTCVGSCRCEPGYYRNKLGDCISKEDCLKCSGKNEFFSCGGACDNVCSNLSVQGQTNCPIINIVCNKMCYCESGYARNANGTCVPFAECEPVKCDVNEEYSTCTQATCRNQKCSEKGKPVACPRIAEGYCIKGCVCKEGYLRAKNGTCIPENQCQPPKQPTCPGPNEEYSGCSNGNCYGPRKCADLGGPTICVDLIAGGCIGGCLCKKGFYRNDKDVCVSEKECRGDCGSFEIFSNCTGGLCRNELCSQQDNPTMCIALADNNCAKGCVCQRNYLRAANGTCIPADQCPPTLKCDVNEEYSTCTQATCRNQKCSEKGKPVACPRIAEGYCIKGCVCKEGYLRAKNGTCIPENQCQPPKQPTCPGPNEEYSGCSNGNCYGPRKCADLGGPTICVDLIAGGCIGGCLCKKGFYRNDKDVCVSEKECRGDCGSFEIFSNCTGGLCRNELCSQQDNPTMCIALADNNCAKGCVCQRNYLRAANGTCIPADQCPPTQEKCGVNEFYDECPPSCSPQLCSQGTKVPCPPSTTVCKPACRCQEGFLRNKEGTCVPQNECSPCPEGELYNTCPAAKCDAEYCPKDRNSPQSCISTKNCGEPRCTCGFNQKRNRKTGKCVAIANCPPFKCDGPNEEYQTCPPVCPGQNCSDYINNSTCPKFGRIGIVVPCKPQCRCKENYYRNSEGICVTGKQCKKEAPAGCGGDPNAEAITGCGSGCRKSCSNYQQFNDLICPAVCRTGCDCKPGYVYDDALKKCVLPKDCNNAGCGGDINAVEITGCGSGCRKSCSNYKQFNDLICPAYCRTGCDCKPNFVYDDNLKKCVVPMDCTQSTTEPTTEPSENNPGNNEDAQQRFLYAINNFTIRFFNEVMNSQKNKSIIMSPFSVAEPLAQLELKANGSSYEQLSRVLNLLKEEIPQVFRALLDSFKNVKDVIISLAAKIYANAKYPLDEDFIDKLKKIFDADAENIDCSDAAKAAALINEYIGQITNNKIKDIVTPDMITPLTRLILVNGIYFKGLWKTPFNRNNTQDRDFHVNKDTTVKLPTMYLKSKFPITTSQELRAQVLEMSYLNGNYSCVFILPIDKYEDLSVTASKLTTESLKKAMDSMIVQEVIVNMPRFKIETSIDLKEILQPLGITYIFESGNSGLTGILKTPEDIYVSTAKQKAFVEVNEEGSEATAANAVVVSTRALPRPPAEEIKFVADHPFVFMIRQKETILFLGAFCK